MRKDAVVKAFPFSEYAQQTLKESGIEQEVARQFGVEEVHPPESVKIYKSLNLGHLPEVSCLTFPYFSMEGIRIDFTRYKPLYGKSVNLGGWQVQAVGKSFPKYVQKGSGCQLYLPPYIKVGDSLEKFNWVRAIEDKEWPLHLLEGEKKAISGMLRSLICASIGGVSNWHNLKRGEGLIPELVRIVSGRQVYLIFDIDESNGWFKDSVKLELEKLCHQLINAGAFVSLVVLPKLRDAKMGLDDWLMTRPKNEPLGSLIVDIQRHSYMSESALVLLEECSRYVYISKQNAVGERDGRYIHLTRSYREGRNNIQVAVSHMTVDKKTGLPKMSLSVMNRADAWMTMGCRPEVKDAVYDPRYSEAVTPEGFFNTYKGYPQKIPEKVTLEEISPFLNFLKKFHGKDAERMVNIYLYPLKHPGAKVFTVPILKTHGTGTGKSTMPELIGEYCYGPSNTAILTADKLKDFKPEHVAARQFCIMDDLNDATTARACVDTLNGLVTTKYLTYSEKYLRPYTAMNFVNFVGTSNKFLPFGDMDNRRLWYPICNLDAFLNQADGRPHQDFYDIRKWFEEGGGGKLIAYARQLHDFKDFDPYARPPASDIKQEIVELSERPIFSWAKRLKERVALYTREIATYQELYALSMSEMYGERELLSLNEKISLPSEAQNAENVKVLRSISFSRTEFAAAMSAAGFERIAKVNDKKNSTSFAVYILDNATSWLIAKDLDILKTLEDTKFDFKKKRRGK